MKYCNMIITIGFVPDTIARAMIEEIGGEIKRYCFSEHYCDVQFKTHKIRTTSDYVTVRNVLTRKYYKLYYNEFSRIHIN